MKYLILFLLICTTTFNVNAQNLQFQKDESSSQEKKSGNAKMLLEEVSKKVKSYENIVIQFEYTVMDQSTGMEQKTRGDVSLKGEKYRLNLMGITRIFDGEKIYTIIPEDEEVNISTYVENNDEGMSPSDILTFYQEGYNFQWDITQNVHGRKIQYIKLTPTDSKNEVDWVLMGIDNRTKHIYKLINKLKDDRQITIKINSFKTNQPLSETLFAFDEKKYEDYYINQMD